MESNGRPIIQLRQVVKNYPLGEGQVEVLKGISFDINAGEYVALVGSSGNGKSTLLNMVAGIDQPTSGAVVVGGRPLHKMNENQLAAWRGPNLGIVFQFFQLVPRLTAFENVELPLMLSGEPVGKRRERVSAILEATGLGDRMHHRPDQLSGGQRQRVAIARATVTEPELILADEPTGNLDSASGSEVIGILERLNAGGMTLIVVTHDADIGRRAQRRLSMIDGRIAADIRGAPE